MESFLKLPYELMLEFASVLPGNESLRVYLGVFKKPVFVILKVIVVCAETVSLGLTIPLSRDAALAVRGIRKNAKIRYLFIPVF